MGGEGGISITCSCGDAHDGFHDHIERDLTALPQPSDELSSLYCQQLKHFCFRQQE